MRSLQHGLGKRNPLLINFDPGASFNLGAYTALDNKTPVTGNPFLASPAASPIDNNTPAAYFTGNNPKTAYPFDNSVSSLKPLTPGSANSANLAWEAFTDNTSLSFGTDGNLFSEGSLNPYELAAKGNQQTEAAQKAAAEKAKLQEKNMQNWLQELFKIFQVIGGSMAGGAVPPTMAAAPSTNNAAAAPAAAPAAT